MKKIFKTRLEAVDWIADNVENEGQFEVVREKLLFNYIYSGTYFIDTDEIKEDIVLLDQED
jgi:hypothetical protein